MVHQPGDIGQESQPGDYYYQSPVFWGTQRQGPDLTHLASRPPIGSNVVWHILHLKAPRAIMPGSVMPSYEYLSDAEPGCVDGISAHSEIAMLYPATWLVLATVALILILFGLGYGWARAQNQFQDVEAAKYRMLEDESEGDGDED